MADDVRHTQSDGNSLMVQRTKNDSVAYKDKIIFMILHDSNMGSILVVVLFL